jgi:hypothetical protein
LQFNQTVEFTVDWYRSWHEGRVDMHEYTKGQIERYGNFASRRCIAWAGG